MSDHQASEQMIGYLYQVRFALYLLLNNDNEQSKISIEKFDDIAFSYDDTPEIMIQLKHHVKSYGDLNNASTDIWRTLKVWLDLIKENESWIYETKFIIITTATAPIDSAANYLRANNETRDSIAAYKLLKKVALESKNKGHSGYYKAFNDISEKLAQQLLDCVYVVDKSSNIVNIELDIRKAIRYSTLPQYEDHVCERLEGWWYKKSIEALCSKEPIFISQSQVRSFIVSVSQEYAPDNLPIDITGFEDVNLEDIPLSDRIFYEQLKIICLRSNRMRVAIRDYYRAFRQRANWVRNDLLYLNELDKYEDRLVDEWEHLFCAMQDDLDDYGDGLTEEVKIKNGKHLFNTIEEKDIRIRERCSNAFVMRGSYQMLANQLKVGWHPDFYERLKSLLKK
ncbi:ABC-three component system protein [Clostridium sp. WILCCON 0269]|uniref:ABC-three component system protein n=1 Tax=Candidatus Clostridium eludens TaxID=3381663 RepID=A0ABW8SRL0_9CLOT